MTGDHAALPIALHPDGTPALRPSPTALAAILEASRQPATVAAAVAALKADLERCLADDPYDYGAMCTRNEALRAAVALVIRDARTDTSLADDAQHIHRHLDEGIRRRL